MKSERRLKQGWTHFVLYVLNSEYRRRYKLVVKESEYTPRRDLEESHQDQNYQGRM
ncbi:MAG: hypothetical protein U9Q06_02910 [Nanoarchaeota archaeon]|nr:hypothetical protein [Nanoarchaeota archaeon]